MLISIDERDDFLAFEGGELFAEFLFVATVERGGARGEVGEGPPHEDRARPRPRSDGEARPFEHLAEVVGRRDAAEHAAARDVVARVAGAAQAADYAVGVEVDGHARDEQRAACPYIRFCEPVGVVALGRDVEYPAALHQGVERVERHPQHYDAQRHLRVTAHEQREDERALEIMGLEQQEQRQRSGFPRAVAQRPQHAHEDEHGRLHQHPPDFVGYRRSVSGIEKIAVAGLEEVERYEYSHGQQGHDEEEDVERLGHFMQSGLLTTA